MRQRRFGVNAVPLIQDQPTDEVSPEQLEDAFDQVQVMIQGPVAYGLGLAYIVMAGIDPFLEPGARGVTVVADTYEAFLGVLWVASGWGITRGFISPRHAGSLTALLAVLVVFNSLLHVTLLELPTEAVAFPLIAIASSVILFRTRHFNAVVAACIVSWAYAIWRFPTMLTGKPLAELSVDMAVMFVVAVLTFRARIHVQARFETLRIQEARQRVRLEAALGALQEAERVRGVFVHSVSHDLRSPLMAVDGFAELLLIDPLTERQSEFIRHIRLAAKRLNGLVSDLVDYAQLESGTFSLSLDESDLSAHVADMLESLRPQAESVKVNLTSHMPEGHILATFDPQRIDQVLTNLVGNAIKFSRAGQTVNVALSSGDRNVRCVVEDSGPGLTPDEVARLFKPYGQLQAGRERGGLGLGLSISKSIVEAHGGEIGIEPHVGGGSTFFFTIPLMVDDPAYAL